MDETQALNASDSARALELIFGKPEENLFVGAGRREKQRRVKYWRAPDHEGATDAGWIKVGPDYMTDAARHERMKTLKGWKELDDRFGLELTGAPNSIISWEARKDQVKRPEKWLEPFIKNGGLTYIIQPNDNYGKPGTYLFPATQLVAYGFHRNPGIKELRPDLAEAVDVECPNEGCINEGDNRRRRFSGVNRAAAERALDSHMAHHKGGEGARSAGREVQKALEAMEAKGGKLDAEAIAQIVASTIVALQQAGTISVTTPEPKKYPDGDPDATWKRPQLMSWAADHGIPQPEKPMSIPTMGWLKYIREHIEA